MLFLNNFKQLWCFTGKQSLKAPQTTIVDIVFLIECVCVYVCVAGCAVGFFYFQDFFFFLHMANGLGSDLQFLCKVFFLKAN